MNRFSAHLRIAFPWFRRKAPALSVGRTLTGYGRVNTWAAEPLKDLKKDLIECAVNGVSIYHIEYAGWAGTSIFTNDRNAWDARKRYKWLVKRCRSLGMWLFVSIVNDNMGLHKYGDNGPKLEKVMTEALCELVYIKSAGKQNVLVQPVAETQSDAGRKFEAEVRDNLAGWGLVWNGSGGHPTGSGGWPHFAVHPSSCANAAKEPAAAIVSTDHGLIIKELGQGGALDGPAKPDKLRALAAAVRARGNPALVYYAFLRRRHDKDAIRALRA